MTQPSVYEKIREAVESIQKRYSTKFENHFRPEVGLILGSGLGSIADLLTNSISIPYSDIPHFHGTTVEGHAGKMVLGKLGDIPVVFLQGRFHYYEGYSMQDI